jgi:hypothetical protein
MRLSRFGTIGKQNRYKCHTPRWENPKGIPTAVMKALGREQLPLDKAAYDARLKELLKGDNYG